VNELSAIFSHLCGQGRCFDIDGSALPVCQRCLGLYVGALLTAAWVLSARLWRRGLPAWSVFVANLAMLLAALLGGLHVLDLGPRWRFACGLWTGHVVTLWLIGAAGALWLAQSGRVELPWRRSDKAAGVLAGPLLAGLAAMFDRLQPLGWWFWSIAAVAGAVCLGLSIAGTALALARWAGSRLLQTTRRRRQRGARS
jgi:uncharacterized membrane protein